jgi:D-alanyl-D-alanine carboxypeptidase (penicillin-binding protein 5/6)
MVFAIYNFLLSLIVRKRSIQYFLVLFLAFSPLGIWAQVFTWDADVEVPELGSPSAVLIDAKTGTFLYLKNPDEVIPPASLTKLMTIHLALKAIGENVELLDEPISPPRESWAINQPPRSSLMFLAAGQRTSLRELFLGLAISSGNDAAVAVALQFAPTVAAFTEMMNIEARALELTKTQFDEPSGISEFNLTTAREFALFCRFYIQEHPETLKEYHSVREFAYPKVENLPDAYRNRPGTILQYNTNRLLGTLEGTDGLKTGYIDEAGYNIALTAQRGETRFIAVILGAPPPRGDTIRNEDGRRLLTWAFNNYKTVFPPVPVLDTPRVWKGKTDYVSLSLGDTLEFTSRTDRADPLYFRVEVLDPLIAPLPAGTSVGDLIYYDSAGELRRIPLLTNEEIEAGGFFKRLLDTIRLFFRDLFAKRF